MNAFLSDRTKAPNPFNPITFIRFDLPEDQNVRIDIYNIRGDHILTLTQAHLPRGSHQLVWNGRDKSGRSVSSGVYLYRWERRISTLVEKWP